MQLRFLIDEDTGLPHIYAHGVDEQEVERVLHKPLEEIRGRRESMIAHGQTTAGRYLKVIYLPDDVEDGMFVITAFDLPPK